MPYLAPLLAAAVVAATSIPSHDIVVQHRSASYEVSYRPHVRTEMKTVGLSAGTRMSTERCRWAMTIQVQREIRRQGESSAMERLLPDTRTLRGDRPGSCTQGRDAIAAEQAARSETLRAHLIEVAQADRATVVADIDSAHALALN
jgi:hypothetical protein